MLSFGSSEKLYVQTYQLNLKNKTKQYNKGVTEFIRVNCFTGHSWFVTFAAQLLYMVDLFG